MRSPPPHISPRRMRACQKVCIWTPDKDLAQCVADDRVVQMDRKAKTMRDADGVREKFGVQPALIADYPGAGRRYGRRLSGTWQASGASARRD